VPTADWSRAHEVRTGAEQYNPAGSQAPEVAMKTVLLLLALFGLAAACRNGAPGPVADLVIVNARVWTGVAAQPEAEAVAIAGGRIAAVGTSADLAAWRGPSTKVIDARGARVLPGFNDSHVHFIGGGMQLDNVNLREAPSPQEFARLIGERARKTPAGEWVLGGDWDDQLWNPPELPTRQLIDPVSPQPRQRSIRLWRRWVGWVV
jgi:hypothetical protein